MRKLCAIFLLVSTSCSVTRAYEGPARPRSEVARVEFSSQKEILVPEKKVGRAELGSFQTRVEVLPGKHPVEVSYERQNVECPSYRDYCLVKTYKGECHGTVKTFAGKSYSVRLSGNTHTPFAKITDTETGHQSGFISCRATGLSAAHRYPENRADYDYERNR